MHLFQSRSFSVSIRLSFLVLVLIYSLLVGQGIISTALSAAAFFIIFFIHEVGHALVARCMGRPCDITIGGAGGKTAIFGPLLKTWQRFIVLLGGPMASFVLGWAVWSILLSSEKIGDVPREFFVSVHHFNALWFFCNLIPVYPFDGGEIFLLFGGALFGRTGQKAAALLSMLIGFLVTMYFLYSLALPGMVIALYCLTESFALFQNPPSLHGDLLSDDGLKIHELQQRWLSGEQELVVDALKHLSRDSREAEARKAAVETCSEYLLELDRFREAYEVLHEAKDALSLSSLEQLTLAGYRTSHWREGLDAGREAFREVPSLPIANLCARLAARLELDEEAVCWLRAAQSHGLEDLSEVLESSDFDSIRSSTVFEKFVRENE